MEYFILSFSKLGTIFKKFGGCQVIYSSRVLVEMYDEICQEHEQLKFYFTVTNKFNI